MTADSSPTAALDGHGADDQPLTEDPRPDGLRSVPSLVLLHTGNGKGKSSSAFGVMVRALALDWPVAVVQLQLQLVLEVIVWLEQMVLVVI